MTRDAGTANHPSSAVRSQPTGAAWVAELRSVIESVEASDVQELEIRIRGLHISLRRLPDPGSGLSSDRVEAALSLSETEVGQSLHAVRCPLTGIWYDAPSPGAPPFVRVGDLIGVGAVVGLLETMKVFNEVHSDAAGWVRQILARRGDLVSAHSPLLTIELAGVPTPGASQLR